MTALYIAGYALGALAIYVRAIWQAAKDEPDFGWHWQDEFILIGFAVMWPLSVPVRRG